jgi:predicted DNA-binding transcriptional regulator YafY
LDYDRKRGGYFYNQQNAVKPYELPGLWFSAEELYGLLICHQILRNISPGIFSQQITQLQQRIDDLFKIRHNSHANISQKIKLLSIWRRLKDDAQFKKSPQSCQSALKSIHLTASNNVQQESKVMPFLAPF